jgi:hypothetical protein
LTGLEKTKAVFTAAADERDAGGTVSAPERTIATPPQDNDGTLAQLLADYQILGTREERQSFVARHCEQLRRELKNGSVRNHVLSALPIEGFVPRREYAAYLASLRDTAKTP